MTLGTIPTPVVRLAVSLGILIAGALPSHPAAADQHEAPIELQETDIFGMGARALGMGLAYTAVSEDVTALAANPAGLVQVRRVELSAGLSHQAFTRTLTHLAASRSDHDRTRLDHIALAYPAPTYRGSLVIGFAFRRYADLSDDLLQEGLLVEPSPSGNGLYEFESYQRKGTVDAWTAGVAWDLSPRFSVGASLSYLTGSSDEFLLLANYRAREVGGQVVLDLGSPSSPDDRVFEVETDRQANVDGYTGAFGFLFFPNRETRVGVSVDLPARLNYDGSARTRQEDYEKIDEFEDFFRDEITLPLTLRAGAAWGKNGLLLAGGLRWTDYTQINFEGDILAPPEPGSLARKPAYRGVVALHAGAEYQLRAPLRVRAGFFTEPLPYDLIAADADFVFVPDDNNPNTNDDISVVARDYPRADIVSDRKFVTFGAGVIVEGALSLDAAFAHGWWERATPGNFENGTDFFPTVRTREKATENRVLVTSTFHFD